MFSKMLICLAIFFTMPVLAVSSGCGDHEGHGQHSGNPAVAAGMKAPDAGNKICPVTGDKVDGKTTYEYKGKVYNFCCPMCIDEFKKNPEKYIKKIEEENIKEGAHQH